ncbi:MAG TPA: hypothetical protein PLL66_06250 [Bacteroidales bacterium]|nr:hypothetical protein [Bacteroidales bacterium]
MDKIYDITTYKGVSTAVELLKKYGWIVSPLPWLIYKAMTPEISTEKQIEAAIQLIKAGKENNAKKMRIRVSHDAGIKISAMLKGFPMNVQVGNNGMMEFDIDYGNASPADFSQLSNIPDKFQS